MNILTKSEKKALHREDWERKIQIEQRKKWIEKISIVTIVILLLGLSFWVIINFTGDSGVKKSELILPELNKNEISYGTESAKVTIVEFADFQCPACALQQPTVKQLKNEYKNKVRFIYRFFPLTSIHANAMNSSRAAFAGYKQNKFWEMYDLLFKRQKDWENLSNPTDLFREYAKELDLNIEQYDKDYSSSESKLFIENQLNEGLKIGINATPTFFINGKQIQNPQSYDEFKKLIEVELNR